MIWPFGNLRELSYDLVVIDCPWPFKLYSDKGNKKSAAKHYKLMTLADIKALPAGRLAQRNCLFFVWVPAPQLAAGIDTMRAWGVQYKTNLIWRKTTASGKVRMGPGFWARTMHEQVLVGTIGKPGKISALPSIFDGVAREHSRKPDEFYTLVEKHTSGLRRADVFSRESRPGWEAFGDEAGKFDKEIAA